MDLLAQADNPVPSGAFTGSFAGYDGAPMRFARWAPTRGQSRGTVCVFPGRGEFIEKYFEVVADLRRRGFTVAILDWRGQGGSHRALANPRKGHIVDFSEYEGDLATFMRDIVLPDCPPPYVALAHSMGGNILLRHAVVAGSWFSRIVLCAPMIGLSEEKLMVSAGFTRVFAEIAVLLGASTRYVPGGSDQPAEAMGFEGNPLTSCPDRCKRNQGLVEAAPQLALGSPTIGWVRAALRSCATILRPEHAVAVSVPLLIFGAGNDRIVSSQATQAFARRLKVGALVTVPGARHEILQETDEIRQQFWAAFDAYLGVETHAA